MQKDYKDTFLELSHTLGIPIEEDNFLLLSRFWQMLEQWNKTINLVSATDARGFFLAHVLDSLTPLPFLPTQPFSLLDLGTGAGLPGIPLKIIRPDIELTLLESSRRRSSFLREVVRLLPLSQVKIINDRVENVIARNEKIFYSVVISRATWRLAPYLAFATFFLAPGGMVVALKGQIPPEEWNEAMHLIETKGNFSFEDHDVTLPGSPRKRRVLIFKYNQ